MRVALLAGIATIATVSITLAAEPPTVGARAASQAASSPPPRADPVEKSTVIFKVRFGDGKPGKPAPAQLQIPALSLAMEIDEGGEGELPPLAKGKVHAKVFVPGAEPCELDFMAPGDKIMTVNLFVPKRGSGKSCERIQH
jgi:hypothetical protein